MQTLRVGIIGLGVGEQHLRSYQQIPGVEVQAICDINEKHLYELKKKYDVPEAFSDSLSITEHPTLDVISVCSYDDAHANQLVSAFNNGKHVMVEKPVALHKKDAEEILRAKTDSGRFISSNLILRESPRFKELKKQISGGEFGEIFCIEADYLHQILWKILTGWRSRMEYYSTIFGGGIHLIDLMRWLVGEEYLEVCGMGNKILTRDSSYKFDDTFINTFRFSSGALAKTLTTLGPQRTKFHSLNVYGTKKTFVNSRPDGQIFSGDSDKDVKTVLTPYPGMKKGDLLPEFISAIREDREPDVSARDVFRVMDVCFAAAESCASRKTVKISYLI